MWNFKVISSILLILVAVNTSSSLSPQSSNTNNTTKAELKFKRLQSCLILTGVSSKNIIQRNSGTEYTELNWQWNTLNGYTTPMAYLLATDISDVQGAVKCCRLLNIRPVARSGGHSYTKSSYGDSCSLIIDLAKLNKISKDPMTMSVDIGPGARNGFMYYNVWKGDHFMIPVGVCPAVGAGGLALGGGWGFFTRQFGLTTDNLLELEMVDAKGKLLVINNSTNEDLFWALRGGGGGSFGIVTKLKLRMYSAPNSIAYGVYQYNFDQFQQFFCAWQSLITSALPNSIGVYLTMEKDKIKMEICNINLGMKENVNPEELLNSFSFPRAINSSMNILTYPEFLLSISQSYSTSSLTNISQLAGLTKYETVGFTKVKSFYVDKILKKDDISKLKVLLCRFLKFATIHMELYGGAVNQFSESETAFIHRGKNMYNIQLRVYSPAEKEMNLEAMEGAMKNFYEESKPVFNHRESYQNYLDQDMPDYLERYYGANLKRLVQIKTKIDPKNLFRHPQSIPVNNKYIV